MKIFAGEFSLHISDYTGFCDDRSDEVYILYSSFNEETIFVEKVLFYRLSLEILMRKVSDFQGGTIIYLILKKDPRIQRVDDRSRTGRALFSVCPYLLSEIHRSNIYNINMESM
jgi:hypothetical protein